jgi:hypothetical protein
MLVGYKVNKPIPKEIERFIPCEKCNGLVEDKCGAVCPNCKWIVPCRTA